MATGQDISARDIAQMLNSRAEALAFTLFPQGRKRAGYFCIGSIRGDEGDSLKIGIKGINQGRWADYAVSPDAVDGKGDMLKLLQLTIGGGSSKEALTEAIRWAKGWLGIDDRAFDKTALAKMRAEARVAQAKAEADDAAAVEEKRRKSVGNWMYAQMFADSPAHKYLAQERGIDFAAIGRLPGAIRYRPDQYSTELREKFGKDRAKTHAMLSLFAGVDGSQQGVHVTFLSLGRDGWQKHAQMEDPKLTLCAFYSGAHISINKGGFKGPLRDIPAGTPVYVSEGIEDGLSMAMLHPDRRIVAAGTLGRIGVMHLPRQAGDLILIGQADPAGSKAVDSLEDAIAMQQERAEADGSKRQVRLIPPPDGFKDWNDVVRGVRL